MKRYICYILFVTFALGSCKKEFKSEDNYKTLIYPNPTTSKVVFNLNLAKVSDVKLILLETKDQKKEIFSGIIGGLYTSSFELGTYPDGLYIFELQVDNAVEQFRVVKKSSLP